MYELVRSSAYQGESPSEGGRGGPFFAAISAYPSRPAAAPHPGPNRLLYTSPMQPRTMEWEIVFIESLLKGFVSIQKTSRIEAMCRCEVSSPNEVTGKVGPSTPNAQPRAASVSLATRPVSGAPIFPAVHCLDSCLRALSWTAQPSPRRLHRRAVPGSAPGLFRLLPQRQGEAEKVAQFLRLGKSRITDEVLQLKLQVRYSSLLRKRRLKWNRANCHERVAIALLCTPLLHLVTKDKINNQPIRARIFPRTSASSSADIAPFRLAFLLRQSRLLI